MTDRERLARGFRLGEWTVKPEDGSLKASGKSARLEPQVMDLLVYLCSRAGQVVPKQDVLDTVWGGRFVSDDTVKGCFYQLRKALGDDSREPKIIETLPKRGFRILVTPSVLDGEPDLYAKGRAALAAETPASLKQARLYFDRFLEIEPDHPAALAGLARTLVAMGALGFGGEAWAEAQKAAARAVELDPKLAEAHLVLAAVRAVHEHDLKGALRELDTAIELSPSDPAALRWRARALAAQGHFDAAVADSGRALDADPLSVPAHRDFLETLLFARRYDQLAEEARRLFEIAPSAADIHLGMVWLYYIQNQHQQAFDAFISGLQGLGVLPAQIEHARDAFHSGGMPQILRLWAALLENEASIGHKTHNDLITLYALLGDADRSFKLIEATFAQGNPFLLSLAVSPLFDNLRGDPRYPQWLARLGLG